MAVIEKKMPDVWNLRRSFEFYEYCLWLFICYIN